MLHADGTKVVLCLVTQRIFFITWGINRNAASGTYPGLLKRNADVAKFLRWLMCMLQLEKQ